MSYPDFWYYSIAGIPFDTHRFYWNRTFCSVFDSMLPDSMVSDDYWDEFSGDIDYSSINDFPDQYDVCEEQFVEQEEYEMHTRNKLDPKRKHNNKYGNHTARIPDDNRPYGNHFNPEIKWDEVVEKFNEKFSVKYKTIIDKQLDVSKKDRFGRRYQYFQRPTVQESMLAKKKTWEVLEVLENNCIKKQLKRNKNSKGQRMLIYTLPVSEAVLEKTEILKLAKLKKDRNANWMVIDDTRYDTRIIHSSAHGSEFTPYGTFKHVETPPGSSRLNGKITVYRTKKQIKELRETPEVEICSTDTYHHAISVNMQKDKKYLAQDPKLPVCTAKVFHVDVDLGTDMQIDAVSTMGRIHQIHSRVETDSDYWAGSQVSKSIKFVREKESHFVTSFELQYRRHGSKEWFSLGNMQGNGDRLTEVLTNVDLIARYLRFVPKTYTRSPSFQIGVFGKPVQISDSSKEGRRGKTTKKNKEIYEQMKPKTITYEVNIPNDNKFYTNSRGKNTMLSELTELRRSEQRRHTAQTIRDELEMFYEDQDNPEYDDTDWLDGCVSTLHYVDFQDDYDSVLGQDECAADQATFNQHLRDFHDVGVLHGSYGDVWYNDQFDGQFDNRSENGDSDETDDSDEKTKEVEEVEDFPPLPSKPIVSDSSSTSSASSASSESSSPSPSPSPSAQLTWPVPVPILDGDWQ